MIEITKYYQAFNIGLTLTTGRARTFIIYYNHSNRYKFVAV